MKTINLSADDFAISMQAGLDSPKLVISGSATSPSTSWFEGGNPEVGSDYAVCRNPQGLTNFNNDFQFTYATYDFNGMTNMTGFSALYSYMSGFDIRNCPNLTKLTLTQNYISDINFEGSNSIDYISLNTNNLTNIDVSKLLNLFFLDVGSNDLSSINVSNNTGLQYLWISSNNLSELDITNCPDLYVLYADRNNISSIDASAQDYFQIFYTTYNSNYTGSNLTHLTGLYRFQSYGCPISDQSMFPSYTEVIEGTGCSWSGPFNMNYITGLRTGDFQYVHFTNLSSSLTGNFPQLYKLNFSFCTGASSVDLSNLNAPVLKQFYIGGAVANPNTVITSVNLTGTSLTYLGLANSTNLGGGLSGLNTIDTSSASFTTINARNCGMSATHLNNVFTELPTKISATCTIYIKDNPGTATCNKSIATGKGWVVNVS